MYRDIDISIGTAAEVQRRGNGRKCEIKQKIKEKESVNSCETGEDEAQQENREKGGTQVCNCELNQAQELTPFATRTYKSLHQIVRKMERRGPIPRAREWAATPQSPLKMRQIRNKLFRD